MARLRKWVRGPLRALGQLPFIAYFLVQNDRRREYSISLGQKLGLVWRMARNLRQVETLSTLVEHLELASALLRVPRSVAGDVIECGCYKGGSSVNLSLVCALVGRRLVVCDSFAGLPEPADYDRFHYAIHSDHTDWYEKGRFAGTLEEVKRNIARHGRIEVCEFVEGYFESTLKHLDRKWVLGFLDVDLIDSLKPCLLSIWPRLQDECRLYVHEARSLFLCALFFDAAWWRDTQLGEAPGFVGAGTGMALVALEGSELGYAQRGSTALRGWTEASLAREKPGRAAAPASPRS